MIDPDALPFVRCRWYRATNGRVIDYVVIHDMEFPERPDSAEWCANYFATTERQASTHFTADNDSIIRCAYDHDVCYSANGVNHNGLHIEMAGYAGQSEGDWRDAYSISMLIKVAALTAALCVRYNVPMVFVDAFGLTQGARGITTHAEAERAFPYDGHSDPGPNFPMDLFVDAVKGITMQDQATFASWLATALGDQARVEATPRGHTVFVQLRDRSTERAEEAAWVAANPGQRYPLESNQRFVWVPWSAAIQFTHLEAD